MTNDEFRQALRVDFKDMTIKTKSTYKMNPTQKQLDYSWQYLNQIQERKTFTFKRETYGNRIIYRATSSMYIKGKHYRKGQFIPKQKRR